MQLVIEGYIAVKKKKLSNKASLFKKKNWCKNVLYYAIFVELKNALLFQSHVEY